MTSIPHSASGAGLRAASTVSTRNLPLDRARTFLTILVLIHHAVIPYTYFGHTDPKFWPGFDGIVLATDSFFMAMFFFLSGLFLLPSLSHRAPVLFLRDRLLRLGLPFVIAALTLMPLAYYAIALRQSEIGFGAFWWKTVTVGPWPSGPLWFLWVLLAFNALGALLYRLWPGLLDPVNRWSMRGFDRPGRFFLGFFAITAIAYVPARVWFGPTEWFEFGPLAVQASRVLLYAAYFFLGAGIGASQIERGILGADGQLPKRWPSFAIATLGSYALLWGLVYLKRGVLLNPPVLPDWFEACYGLVFALFSAAIIFTILAIFLRFARSGWSLLDPLQNDAYGIFLVHYTFMLWLQYWLFDFDLPAIVKATTVLVLALGLSWATSAALRRIPGAKRVL